MMIIRAIWISARPRQWIKNCFVFAALIFVRAFMDRDAVLTSVLAFVVFCVGSSAVYIVNDLLDRKQDQLHPTKRLRPIASGQVSPGVVLTVAMVGMLGAAAGGYAISPLFGLCVLAYILVNVAYSLLLKHIVIIDVITVACGFVLRVIGGAIAIGVSFSPWIIFCTFFLTLFLAVCKRKSELLLLPQIESRRVLSQYSLGFIDQMNTVLLPMTLVTYTFYTFSSEHSQWFMLTVPVVMYGLFRYVFIINTKQNHNDGPADDFLADRPLQLTVFVWLVLAVVLLWYGQ